MKNLLVKISSIRLSGTEIVFASALMAALLVYAFFFVIAPQHWSLIDHYAHALKWGTRFDPVADMLDVIASLKTFGRFRPIDIASWMLRYRFLPVTPRAFHLVQFGLMTAMFLSLGNFVFRATRGKGNVLLALLLAVGALSFKDWIFHTSAGDPLATTFLITAFALYAAGRKPLAAATFICAFLTKESYFVFFFSFAVLEFFMRKSGKSGWKNYVPLAVMGIGAAAFVLYVRSLPLVYASGFGLGNFSVVGAMKAFTLPALKSFLPAFPMVAYTFWKNGKKLTPERTALLAVGVSIVGIYTLFMVLWSPFDSWFYMHIPIPFGWAMIFAALWFPSEKNDGIHTAFIIGLSAYLVLSVLNGSRNFYTFFGEAKVVARVACDDAKRSPGLKIFSNCNEGSLQLRNYLILEKACENPPEFIYLQGKSSVPEGTSPPYEVVWADRCDPTNLDSIPGETTFTLEWWKIRRNFSASRP